LKAYPALDIRTDSPDVAVAFADDFGPTAVDDQHPGSVRIFFPTAAARDAARDALASRFDTSAIDVPDDDWARRSQENLTPITVGRITIVPRPDAALLDPDAITIVVVPSMGFGTGHHATTRLCLAAMQEIDMRGKTVIDVGTGSGVLAIAASLLGAANVIAFDDDNDAVSAARENLGLNPRSRVTLQVGDLRDAAPANADVVLANLTGALLASSAIRLKQLTDSGGRLILSGFMASEEREVLDAFAPLAVEHRAQEEEWLCVTLR